jgi:hypothetical protein
MKVWDGDKSNARTAFVVCKLQSKYLGAYTDNPEQFLKDVERIPIRSILLMVFSNAEPLTEVHKT